MNSFVRTVTGDILPKQLGITQGHEHTIVLPGPGSETNPALLLDDPAIAVRELTAFRTVGGCSVVDAQPMGVERSPRLMKEVSLQSGIQIIATTGVHRGLFYPENHFVRTCSVGQLTERIVREITIGMIDDTTNEQTEIKAGLVKFTSEYHHIPPLVQKVAEAVSAAHHETHASIITHTEQGTCGLEQIELMQKYNVPASSMILSHLDRNPDRFLHKEIAATGVFLVYDGIGRTKYWPDSTIIDLILEMVDAGFGSQILLAMDSIRTTWKNYGYGPGLDYLLHRFIPRLQSAGASEKTIRQLLVENPARAFQFIP